MAKKPINYRSLLLPGILILLTLAAGGVIFFALKQSDTSEKHETIQDIPTEASQSTNILVYDVATPDTSFSGTAKEKNTEASVPLKFRTIRSTDYDYDDEREQYKTTVVRLATRTDMTLSVTIPGNPTSAVLRSPTADLPVTVTNSTATFDLPAAPGNYYLKTNLPDDGEYIQTMVFWVDKLDDITVTKPAQAIEVLPGQPLQAVIDGAQPGTMIYLAPGIHAAGGIRIDSKNDIALIFHPNAVLNQTSTDEKFIDINRSSNVTLKGPGEIRAAKGNGETVLYAHDSNNLIFNDFFIYKIHHRDGWTLHVYRNDTVQVNQVRIISGNDGTDPDSSKNVTYNNMYIEAQDDAVAVKTRGGEANTITLNNVLAKSAASSLKIGEATVDSLTTNITFKNSTVFDSDRALVVMPRGNGRIGNVLYQNIRVLSMRSNKEGKTIRVLKSATDTSGSIFDGSSIVFDNVYAEFIKPAEIRQAVTIKHSKFVSNSAMNIFPDTCPTLINLTLEGGATTTCTIQTEPTYTPTPSVGGATPTPTSPAATATIPAGTTPTATTVPSTPTPTTAAPTPSHTATPTLTPTPTATLTPTSTPTPTATPTPTSTPTPTATPTATFTPTPTFTLTPTPTYTPVPTATFTPAPELKVNGQPPGFNPFIIVGIPIAVILLGLLL